MKIIVCLIAALLLASYQVEATYVPCTQDEIQNSITLNLALNAGVKVIFEETAKKNGISAAELAITQITSVSKEDLTTSINYKFKLSASNDMGMSISTTFTVAVDVKTNKCTVNQGYTIQIVLSTNYCAKVNADSLVNQITQAGVKSVFQLAATEYGISTNGVVISKVNSVTSKTTYSKVTYACDVDATNEDGAVVSSTFTVEYACQTKAITVKNPVYNVNCHYCAKVDADSLIQAILQFGIEEVFVQAATEHGISTSGISITNVKSVDIDKQDNEINYLCEVEATNEEGVIVNATFIIGYDCKTTDKVVKDSSYTIDLNNEEEEEEEVEEEEEEEIDDVEEEEVEEEEDECEDGGEEEEVEEEQEEEIDDVEEEEVEEEEEEIIEEEEEDEDNEEEEEVEEEEIDDGGYGEEEEEEDDGGYGEEEEEEDDGGYGDGEGDEGDDEKDTKIEVDVSVHVHVDVEPGCGGVHTTVN